MRIATFKTAKYRSGPAERTTQHSLHYSKLRSSGDEETLLESGLDAMLYARTAHPNFLQVPLRGCSGPPSAGSLRRQPLCSSRRQPIPTWPYPLTLSPPPTTMNLFSADRTRSVALALAVSLSQSQSRSRGLGRAQEEKKRPRRAPGYHLAFLELMAA